MNIKQIITTLIALLISIITTNAQSDSLKKNKDIVIEKKKYRIIIKEKTDSATKKREIVIIADGDLIENVEIKDNNNKEDDDKDDSFIETKWLGVQLGLNNLMDFDHKFEMPKDYENMKINSSNSFNFQLNFIEQAINIYGEHIRLVYAIGIDYNNYSFSKNVDLVLDDKSAPIVPVINKDNSYSKNKLVTKYLSLPVLLDFNIGPKNKNQLKIAFGPHLGYLVGSHQKQKWKTDGKKQKRKIKGDYDLETFRLGYQAQFGYGPLTLYAKYFPEFMFKNHGLGVSTASMGLVLTAI